MPTIYGPSEEDKTILRKQLKLLSERSEQNLSVTELVDICNAMARIEAVIIGYEKEKR